MNMQSPACVFAGPQFILFGTQQVPRTVKDDGANRISGKTEQGIWLYSDHVRTGTKFGIWECIAGQFKVKMDGFTEFCHIIGGRTGNGQVLADRPRPTVRADDSFVMEAGFEAKWYVPIYIKKCFAISSLSGAV